MQRLLSLFVIWAMAFGSTPALSLTVNGQLKGAILEKSSSDLSDWEGRVYWNTTAKQAKVYNGTDWTTLGSGSGGDGLDNQIENARAEEPVVPTSFKVYDDGAVDAPVDCTGGTPTAIQAWTRSTSSPIQGDASWLLQKDDAEDAQGQGWAIEFTVPADHPMASSYYAAFNFDFKFSDSDGPGVRIYVYDVTNSKKIVPQFVSGGGGDNPVLTPVTSSTSRAQLGFQTTNGTSYRICVHNADTDTDGYSLKVDGLLATTEGGVQVGPSDQFLGEISGLTTSGTLARTVSIKNSAWRRGSVLVMKFAVSLSGAASGSGGIQFTLNLPSGYTIDANRLPDTSAIAADFNTVGYFQTYGVETSGTYDHVSSVIPANSTSLRFIRPGFGTAYASDHLNTTDAQQFEGTISIPIVEWAGGTAVGENNCEWASNSSATDADDTTSFVYGPYGSTGILNTTALGSTIRKKRVRFRSASQPTDEKLIEFYVNGEWVPAVGAMVDATNFKAMHELTFGASATPGGAHGVAWEPVSGSSTDFDVYFGRYAWVANDNTGATAWDDSGLASGMKWRFKRCSAGVPVPYGMATSERPGLVYKQSGTYTPTLSAASNVAGSSITGAAYNCDDFSCTVFGSMKVQPTAANTGTGFSMSLPVARASNFTSFSQAGGTGAADNGSAGNTAWRIGASTGSQTVAWYAYPSSTTNADIAFTFTYRLQ